jgi:hypothetical protein
LYSLIAVASLLALPSLARADSPLDFTLKNRLGVTITHVYISPHQADGWEEDLLGKSTLADNKETKIHFGDAQVRRGDIWDLKIKTSDGKEYEWRQPGFNLRKITEITIILKDGTASAVSK